MEIIKSKNNSKLTLSLCGRLDTTSAPLLEKEVRSLDGVKELVLDFEKLDYVSSAGLRVLLVAQKTMTKQGKLVVRNVNEAIRDVFEMTGFADFLTIE